jgi:hypothetical protein
MWNFIKFSFFLCCLFLIGCAAGIKRTGYTQEEIEHFNDYSNCHIKIKKEANLDGYDFRLMGKVKVYDTEFSMDCDEEYVFSLLRNEACALGADLINITNEKPPNFWSTCYQVEVELLKILNEEQASKIVSDPHYEWSLIQERGAKGRKKQKTRFSGAVTGGAIGGANVGH